MTRMRAVLHTGPKGGNRHWSIQVERSHRRSPDGPIEWSDDWTAIGSLDADAPESKAVASAINVFSSEEFR